MIFGQTDLVNKESHPYRREVDYIIPHGDYKRDTATADVALVHLKEPATFDENVQPVCLVDGHEDAVTFTQDKHCFAVGYGRVEGGRSAVRLQKLAITATSHDVCRKQEGLNPQEGHVCTVARDTNQASPCKVSIDFGLLLALGLNDIVPVSNASI